MLHFSRVLFGALGLTLSCLLALPAQAAEPKMRDRKNATDLGIWKSYSPRGFKGEFNNYDPIGLMSGALIRADCSINWVDPDTRKIYCFASGTSFNYFQDWPKTYARRASEAFEKVKRESPGS